MYKFKQWYIANQIKISWFVIGFLIAVAIQEFSTGQYADALFSLVLAAANYYLSQD